jgi:purine nucleosidase
MTGVQQTPRRVLLDTDLGSDVDDALALALLLGSPEVELAGVTTVYGDALLRARAASRLLELAGVAGAGSPALPVLPGATEPLSGAPVWWAGHEGTLLGDLASAPTTPVSAPTDAADWLAAQVAAAPGELDVVAIGPLTNIALAVQRSPGFARDVRHLWVMGGRWDGAVERAEDGSEHLEGEHNLRSDAVAAAVVLGCGAPTTVTGTDVTTQVHLGPDDVAAIAAAGPAGAVLAAQVEQWMGFWEEPWDVPHDPVAVLAALRPDLVTTSAPGTAEVVADGPGAGAVRHTPDPEGTVRFVSAVDAAALAAEVRRRVVAGCTAR